MKKAMVFWLAAMLLTGRLVSQASRPEPFSFKNDKLGMSLEDFKAIHLEPGDWENAATKTVAGFDFHRPPKGKSWKWKPDLNCKELVDGVITQCQYSATIGGSLGVSSSDMFVDGSLAVVGLSYASPSPLVQQALVDKLGPPARVPVGGNSNRGLVALRWDNGVSVVEFQEQYCGSGIWTGDISRKSWNNDISEVLRGSYCTNGDAGDFGHAFVWYVHRSLFSQTVTRWNGAIEEVKERARSEPFTFDDKLGVSLEDFNARHGNPGAGKVETAVKAARTLQTQEVSCKETARAVTECDYFVTILGLRAFAKAIFADDKLAAIQLNYISYGSQSAVVSGVLVPVNVRQALIDKFGRPEIIRGYGDSELAGDDLHALHWDNGASVVEYQDNNCGRGNAFEKITKILQRRYCEKGESGDGTVSIWDVDKSLFSVAMARHREAEESARKKARSDI